MKRIFTLIILACAFCSQIFAGTAKVYVYSSPQKGGFVYVNTSNSAPSGYSLTKDNASLSGVGNQKFYLYYSAKPGYKFKNWLGTTESDYNNATEVTGNSGLTSQGQSVTVSAPLFGTNASYYAAVFSPIQYYVAFDGNNNTAGEMETMTFKYDIPQSLTPNAFSRQYSLTFDAGEGECAVSAQTLEYSFAGWNTLQDGTGTAFGDNAQVQNLTTAGGTTVTLFAQWNAPDFQLPNATRDDFVLEGWYDGATKVGEAGEPYAPTEDVTLTAHWAERFTPVMEGADATMLVGAAQENAFFFKHVDNPQVHIESDIDPINNGDGYVIEYDADNNRIIAHNAGTATIWFTQSQTPTIEGADSEKFHYTVSKHDNALTCSWADWKKTVYINESAEVHFATNNTDYDLTPIVFEQTKGPEVAKLAQNGATSATVTASYNNDYATWHVSQPEDSKYKKAEGDIRLDVIYKTSPGCYVLNDGSEHTFSTAISDFSGHYDTPIEVNGPVDKLSFEAMRTGVNYFVVEYTVDNGINWRTIDNPDLTTSYASYGPYSFSGLQNNERVTHIRFGAKTGATGAKYYRNIRITRKTYMNLKDEDNKAVSSLMMPTNTIGNSTTAKFYIDYSTCADSVKLAVNNSLFTLSETKFASNGDNLDDLREITVTYKSDTAGMHTATITVYTDYMQRTINVTGITEKKTQIIEWGNGYEGNPLSLPYGLKAGGKAVAKAPSQNVVTFVSGNPNIIRVSDDGYWFEVVGIGSTTLTAHADGNSDWKTANDEKTVNTSNKTVQRVVWTRTFTKGLKIDDVKDLDAQVYLMNAETGEMTFSEERTGEIVYSCPEGNGVISVEGAQMTVLGYGQTTLAVTAPGNDDFVEAQLTLIVRVREPSTGCETPFVLEHDGLQLFSMAMDLSNYTTPQITSEIIPLEASKGKPDKLSFQYEGEYYTVPVISISLFRGTIKAQQRINGKWSDVPNSEVEPTVGTWKELTNLQLDENANAIRFVRPEGGQGYHNVSDIKVTLKQYLRLENTIIDLGTMRAGEKRTGEVITFAYSDVKGDLTVSLSDVEPDLTIDQTVELDCGSHGVYSLPFAFLPTHANEYWTETVTIKDPLSSLSQDVILTARITESDQWIIWNPELEMYLPDVPVLNATATSGLDVEYEITEGSDIASIQFGRVVVSAPGTITIVAKQPGNDIFPKAIPVEKTFVVHRAKYIFVGNSDYADEWTQYDNWAHFELLSRPLPALCDSVELKHNAVLTTDEAVYRLDIDDNDTLFIAASGGLTVGKGGIHLNGAGTGHIVIKGYLRVSPENVSDLPQATVQVLGNTYIGSPLQTDEPFRAFLANESEVTFKGELIPNRGIQEIALSADNQGLNNLANSFVAPIDLLQLEENDFTNAEATINLYNLSNEQYTALPIYTLQELEPVSTLLLPLQGFTVVANDENASMRFDYERQVWNGHYGTKNTRREAKTASATAKLGLTLQAAGLTDDAFLLESDQYDKAFENGYDAHKLTSGAFNVFAVEQTEQLSVDATDQIAETYIGVRSGAVTDYTLVFTRVSDDDKWSLVDYEQKIMVDMTQGDSYSFTAEPNTVITSRFQVVLRGAQIPETTTGTENIDEPVRVQKFIKDNQLFILKNGMLYNVTGAKVR
jgi:uncharacterized repeat protein (TIGR02543 family)